jgi:hypothetical protein
MHSPIDDFINLWGYPNQIINMPDGSKQYVFMVEIAPLSHRTLLLTTNSSGEIVALRVDVEKAQ